MLADDHRIVMRGVRVLLEEAGHIVICEVITGNRKTAIEGVKLVTA